MKKPEVYKCKICGLTIEVLTGCGCPSPVLCCGQPMNLMPEQTAEFKTEKHVPYPTSSGSGTKVVVGECMLHPMVDNHYIEWIEIENGAYVNRQYLKPGDAPSAEFYVPLQKGMIVREFCNVHGLWKYEVK